MHITDMYEAYVTYVDDEYVDNHDYDDDTDDDTNNNEQKSEFFSIKKSILGHATPLIIVMIVKMFIINRS